MSRLVRAYLPALKRVRKMAEKSRREYIRKCDNEFIRCVSECCKNLIKGNVPMTARQKSRLRPNRRNVRALALKKTSLRTKRRILQRGGLLSALLPPILGVLGSMLLN